MRYCLITFFFAVCSVGHVSAQKSLFRKADQEFSRMRFKAAVQYYEKGLASDSLDILSVERLALSYKNIRDYQNAEKWFARAIYLSPENKNYYLHYAEALASNKKYESSAYWYRKLGETGDARGINFSKSYDRNLSAFYVDSTQWKIRFTSLNTTFDEFSPAFYKKGLIFSSNRHFSVRNKLVSGWDLKPFVDLYLAEDTAIITHFDILLADKSEKAGTKSPPRVQDNRTVGDFGVRGLSGSGVYSFNAKPTQAHRLKGALRSKFHDGPVSLSGNQQFMMFTRNNLFKGKEHLSRDGVNRLKLYSAALRNDKWVDIKEFEYNSNQYSTAHPSLSADGNTLYFSSDMPGGIGGMDLYYSTKLVGKWSRPVNLGPKVNTKGDEVFPFLSTSNELYFSSTGLPGLGGMDMFRVPIADYLPADQPVNIGYPANSPKDDFGIILRQNTYSGYFSSNRKGNDDIYSFEYNPVKLSLNGIIVNEQKVPVNGATVLISSQGKVDTLKTLSDGRFRMKLKKDSDYQIQSVKDGVQSGITSVSTKEKNGSEEIILTLVLAEAYQEVQTGSKSVNKPAVVLPKPEQSHVSPGTLPESKQPVVAVIETKEQVREPKKIPSVTPAQKPVDYQKQISVTTTTAKPSLSSASVKRVPAQMKPVSVQQDEVPALTCLDLQKKYYVDNIYYTLDKAYIRGSEIPVLERLVGLMSDHAEIQVIVNSHTDSTASDQYNEALSNKRSTVVKGYLVSRGIDEARIQTRYFGKKRPLIPCAAAHCTADEMQLNRRTEFYIILNGRNITMGCTDAF